MRDYEIYKKHWKSSNPRKVHITFKATEKAAKQEVDKLNNKRSKKEIMQETQYYWGKRDINNRR